MFAEFTLEDRPSLAQARIMFKTFKSFKQFKSLKPLGKLPDSSDALTS